MKINWTAHAQSSQNLPWLMRNNYTNSLINSRQMNRPSLELSSMVPRDLHARAAALAQASLQQRTLAALWQETSCLHAHLRVHIWGWKQDAPMPVQTIPELLLPNHWFQEGLSTNIMTALGLYIENTSFSLGQVLIICTLPPSGGPPRFEFPSSTRARAPEGHPTRRAQK